MEHLGTEPPRTGSRVCEAAFADGGPYVAAAAVGNDIPGPRMTCRMCTGNRRLESVRRGVRRVAQVYRKEPAQADGDGTSFLIQSTKARAAGVSSCRAGVMRK